MRDLPLSSGCTPHGPRSRRARRAVLLAMLAALPGWTDAPGGTGDTGTAAPTIVLHVGVPGIAHIGQPLKDVVEKLPGAKVGPFAGQRDAVIVSAPEAGISCYAVGPAPESLAVASVGFNFAAGYERSAATTYRTAEGIGAGSTVDDLLKAYGPPLETTGDRATNPALRRGPPKEDPLAPKKYHYASADGSVKTYFVVQEGRVLRMVINDLAPLDRHILKRPAAPAD